MNSDLARKCIQEGTVYGAGVSFWLFVIIKLAIMWA